MDNDTIRKLLDAATPGYPEVERCPCGQPGCRKYAISIGTFYQGSGWDDEADARLFAGARYAFEEVLRLRAELAALNEHPQSRLIEAEEAP